MILPLFTLRFSSRKKTIFLLTTNVILISFASLSMPLVSPSLFIFYFFEYMQWIPWNVMKNITTMCFSRQGNVLGEFKDDGWMALTNFEIIANLFSNIFLFVFFFFLLNSCAASLQPYHLLMLKCLATLNAHAVARPKSLH